MDEVLAMVLKHLKKERDESSSQESIEHNINQPQKQEDRNPKKGNWSPPGQQSQPQNRQAYPNSGGYGRQGYQNYNRSYQRWDDNNPSQPRFPTTFNPVCYNCQQRGHLQRNCPLPPTRPAGGYGGMQNRQQGFLGNQGSGNWGSGRMSIGPSQQAPVPAATNDAAETLPKQGQDQVNQTGPSQ